MKLIGRLIFLMLFFSALAFSYVINGDSITYSNVYGSITETPHTIRGSGEQYFYVDITSNLTATFDIAFRFKDSGMVPRAAWTKTAGVWTDISGMFRKTTYQGDEVYYIESVSFTQGQTRQLKAMAYISGAVVAGKYDLFIKRSSDSWEDAITGVAPSVYLDPWYNISRAYKQKYLINSSVLTSQINFVLDLVFNHTALVAAGKSLADGSDLIVSWNQNENESLCFMALNGTLNTGNTTLRMRIPLLNNSNGTGGNLTTIYLYYDGTVSPLPTSSMNPNCIYTNNYSRAWPLDGYSGVVPDQYKFIDYAKNGNLTNNGTLSQIILPQYKDSLGLRNLDPPDGPQTNFIWGTNPNLVGIPHTISLDLWFNTTQCASKNCVNSNSSIILGTYQAILAPFGWMLKQHNTDAGGNLSTIYITMDGGATLLTYNQVPIDKWFHLDIREDSITSCSIWINGVSKASGACGTNPGNTNGTFLGLGKGLRYAAASYNESYVRGYIANVEIANIARSNDWLYAKTHYTISASGPEAAFNSTGANLTLTDCSAVGGGSFPVLYFNLKDEEDFHALNGSFYMSFQLYNISNSNQLVGTYSIQVDNKDSFSLCFDSYSSAYASSFQQYNASGYPSRAYFLLKANLSAAYPQTITLYLENSTLAVSTIITVLDQNSRPIANDYIAIQRFYPANSTYYLIAMSKTDSNGMATTYLRPNVPYYREIVYTDSGTVIQSFGPAFIPCDPSATLCNLVLQVIAGQPGTYWKILNGIAHNCSYSNSTGSPLVACTFLDTTGLNQNVSLTLFSMAGTNLGAVLCFNTSYSTMDTLICSLSPTGSYTWTLSTGNPLFILESGAISLGEVASFGAIGLFLGFVIIMAMGLFGLMFGSPSIVIAFTVLGLIASWLLSLIVISAATMVAIVILAIVVIFIMRGA